MWAALPEKEVLLFEDETHIDVKIPLALTSLETEGAGMPTTAQFNTIDSHLASFGASNFQLLSFIFTTDPTNPKITFLYSYVQNSITVKEQVVLTLIDGTTGWLINARDNQQMH